MTDDGFRWWHDGHDAGLTAFERYGDHPSPPAELRHEPRTLRPAVPRQPLGRHALADAGYSGRSARCSPARTTAAEADFPSGWACPSMSSTLARRRIGAEHLSSVRGVARSCAVRRCVLCGVFHVEHRTEWRRRPGRRAPPFPFTGPIHRARSVGSSAARGTSGPSTKRCLGPVGHISGSAPRTSPVRRGEIDAVANTPRKRAGRGNPQSAVSRQARRWPGAGPNAMPPGRMFHGKHPRQSDARVPKPAEPR